MIMNMSTSIRQSNEGAFPIVRAPDPYPTIASGKAFRLKRDIANSLTLSRRYMDRVDDSVDDDVDPIGVGGTDVVAELLVARMWLL